MPPIYDCSMGFYTAPTSGTESFQVKVSASGKNAEADVTVTRCAATPIGPRFSAGQERLRCAIPMMLTGASPASGLAPLEGSSEIRPAS